MAALTLAAAALAPNAVRPDLDAERLRRGAFIYRTIVDGKEAGRSRIEVRRAESGDFVFTNRVEGAFVQSWEAVAARDFAPRSARLTTGASDAARVVFDLVYRGGRVTGFASSPASGSGGVAERRSVNETIGADTVDQRIDWAAVMARPGYAPGDAFVFHVYDPATGHSRVAARVAGFEKTTVPAGAFDTIRIEYRIDKNRGAETYEVFAARESPRFLVEERFPNGAVTELVEASPAR